MIIIYDLFRIDYWTVIYLFIIPLILSLVLTKIVRALACKLEIYDFPQDDRKIHTKPVPYLGGIAIYLSFIIGLAIVYYRYPVHFVTSKMALKGILLGSLPIIITGLLDDIYGIKYYWKFAGQILAALIIIWFDIKIVFFTEHIILSYILTVLWVVGITNSFNLLDNMNGLSAGVAAIAGLFSCFIAESQGESFVAIISLVFTAATIGFLRFNLIKGNIFMGDTGSMFLGYILSIISILGVYLKSSKLQHLPIIAPLIILGIPIFDTFSVIIIRIRQGQSIFKADKQHFSHRLEKHGLSQFQSVLLIYIIAFIMGATAVFLTKLDLMEMFLAVLQNIALIIIVVMLMWPTANE